MELIGQQRIAAPIDRTWVALNDPGVLKECIAGCETIDRISDREYAVAMGVKIGPVNAKFRGKLLLDNLVPPQSYTINFEGQGGVAGFGKGSADVKLTPDGSSTVLDYAARAQVGGKIAQIGSRLVDIAAKKMADDFFNAFNAKVGSAQVADASAAEAGALTAASVGSGDGTGRGTVAAAGVAADSTAPNPRRNEGTPTWVWLALAAAVVAAIVAFAGK